jgi:HAD superfamily hydrolase (TIGR01490 family)
LDSRTHVAIFDLDGTITRNDTYVAFLCFVMRKRPVRLLKAWWLPFALLIHKLGIKDNSWLKEVFLGVIAGGFIRTEVDAWAQIFTSRLIRNGVHGDALAEIKQHADSGHKLVLASASFDFYVELLAGALGFNDVICTASSWDDSGKLQGRIDGINCYGPWKLQRLKEYLEQFQCDTFTYGYSDHHSDFSLLDWVDRGVAVNPSTKLAVLAHDADLQILQWQ